MGLLDSISPDYGSGLLNGLPASWQYNPQGAGTFPQMGGAPDPTQAAQDPSFGARIGAGLQNFYNGAASGGILGAAMGGANGLMTGTTQQPQTPQASGAGGAAAPQVPTLAAGPQPAPFALSPPRPQINLGQAYANLRRGQ